MVATASDLQQKQPQHTRTPETVSRDCIFRQQPSQDAALHQGFVENFHFRCIHALKNCVTMTHSAGICGKIGQQLPKHVVCREFRRRRMAPTSE